MVRVDGFSGLGTTFSNCMGLLRTTSAASLFQIVGRPVPQMGVSRTCAEERREARQEVLISQPAIGACRQRGRAGGQILMGTENDNQRYSLLLSRSHRSRSIDARRPEVDQDEAWSMSNDF